MAVTAKLYGNFLLKALNKEVDFDTDAIKLALYTALTLDQDGDITEIDLLLESWVVNNRVIGMWCADMNKDNIYDEDDYLCVKAILDGDTAAQEEYCTACIVKMQRLGRYGDEICHDGLDNDCDDLIDDADNGECDDCEEGQTCDREYDSDSVYNTDDFKYCKHISEIPNVGDGDWEWLFDDDLEDMCESCSDWKLHWACGRGTDQETGSTCLPDCSGEVEWAGIPEVECSSLGTYMKGVAGVECPSEACVAVKACGSGYRVTNANACPNTWVDISAYLRHGAPTEAEVGTIPTGETEAVTRCCVPGPCTACTTLTPVTTASCTRTSGGGGKGGHRPSRP